MSMSAVGLKFCRRFQAASGLLSNPCRGVVSAAGAQEMWNHSRRVLIPITTPNSTSRALYGKSGENTPLDAWTDNLNPHEEPHFLLRWAIISFTAVKRANLYEYVLTSQPVRVDFAD